MKKDITPLVSVLIPTKNSASLLELALKSIQKQSYKKLEIIVVDNYSVDHTIMIAKKYTKQVYKHGHERSAQRNFGALKKANGKYLFFLDSDMSVSRNLIRDCVYTLEKDPKAVGLYISEIILGSSFWNRVRRFERIFYNATVIDAARFIRKDIFVKTGGYDENLYACEDWDLDKRLKKLGPIGLTNTPLFHNESKFNIKEYLDKKNYYTNNFNIYIDKWGKDDPDIEKQFGPAYRLFWVFVENGKWKVLVKHPIKALFVIILRVLASWKYFIIRIKVKL